MGQVKAPWRFALCMPMLNSERKSLELLDIAGLLLLAIRLSHASLASLYSQPYLSSS